MLFRRRDHVRKCPVCRSDLACPLSWEPSDDEHWSVDLRCGDCEHRWNAIIDDQRAARYDLELDRDRRAIEGALAQLDLSRMTFEVEAFAEALSKDLIQPADFVA
jgi:hypothetical protein